MNETTLEIVKTVGLIAGIIASLIAVFFAGWNLSKSKNGYVKRSECLLHQKKIEEKDESQTRTLILLDRKVNQILGFIRASNGQGLEG